MLKYFIDKNQYKKFQLYLLCDELVSSGLLKKVNKENNKIKESVYILNDLFAYFEYYWDFKNIDYGNDYNTWKSNAFEIFIFNHFEQIAKSLNIEYKKDNLFLNWKTKDAQKALLIYYIKKILKNKIFIMLLNVNIIQKIDVWRKMKSIILEKNVIQF